MRKYIIIYIMLACLPMAARGQTITDLADIDLSGLPQRTSAKALRYWFDDDAALVQTTNQLSGNQLLDVSGLIEGLHTLHYQVIDTEDDVAYVGSGLFLKVAHSTSLSVKSMRYWFDDDAASVQTAGGTTGTYTLDVKGLTEGLHTLHYQLIDESGVAAYVGSGFFICTGSSIGSETVKAQKLLFWFDDQTTMQHADISEGTQVLDASGLMEGLHTLHYQVLCNNGQMTPSMSTLFLRVNADAETAVAKNLRYWFDDEQTATEVEITEGVQQLDASGLIEGLHTVHYQIANSNGTLGAPYSSIFLMMNWDTATSTAKSLRYWFDDNAATVATTSVAGGTQTLDVSALPTGLHTLNYQLIDSQGRVTAPVTRLFMKNFDKVLADGHNRVTKYQYWLNMNSQAMQTVELDAVSNPYTLIALLPMKKEPIQSSQFHFEITNGVPTIYAKNTLHVRFYDAQNYFTDGDKPFIDYSVKQDVEPVGELQPTQTFPKVAWNDIRWYTVNVEAGDTLAFKTNQATTLQLFAPSGEELYKAEGSSSVNFGGCHTWETGTHYLAVHDVTGTQNDLTLDYMHMDKYDVVDWDVHTVGNGGCSTITFKGNGFRDLYAVDLYTAEGDTIHSVDVSHNSDAETAVIFDFTDVTLGDYNMVFHFTNEDKHVSDLVTVEEPKDIALTKTVSFPSAFPHGRSTTYTVKITNHGNMTAYSVPIYTWIMNRGKKDGIYHIKYDGLDLPGIFDGLDMDSLSVSERAELQALSDEMGDSHYFMLFRVENEDSPGDSVWVRSNYFFTNLAPYETKTLKLTLSANEGVWAYFTVPEEWNPLFSGSVSTPYSERSNIKKLNGLADGYCCVSTMIECSLEMMSTACDIISPTLAFIGLATQQPVIDLASVAVALKGCEISMKNDKLKAFNQAFCSSEEDMLNRLVNSLKSSYRFSWSTGTILSCIGATISGLGIPASKIQDFLSTMAYSIGLATLYNDFFPADEPSCKKMQEPIPNCPRCDGCGDGGGSGGGSWDPNDIFGYLSKAGSHFIADFVDNVNYTIEFENDTALAMTAAHSVVIRDTLDGRYFDLNTFVPTKLRIGSHEVFLDEKDITKSNGVTRFLKTIDMRPEINAIAQAEGMFNQKTGIAEWRLTSLDPMTMEPANDVMQGILPVNYNGTSGIGEVIFEIGVKSGKEDGTALQNRACITFDANEPIQTPTWTNIVDATAPTSLVAGGVQTNDTTLVLKLYGEDNLSGVWKYDVYAQMGEGTPWELVAANVADSVCEVRIYEGIEYAFCAMATDSAGNVERKTFASEYAMTTVTLGDANGDGTVDALDVVLATSYYLGNQVYLNFAATDVVADGEINSLDVVAIQNIYLNTTSGGKTLAPRRRRVKHK